MHAWSMLHAAGTMIGEYAGEVIDQQEEDLRLRACFAQHEPFYMFKLDATTVHARAPFHHVVVDVCCDADG